MVKEEGSGEEEREGGVAEGEKMGHMSEGTYVIGDRMLSSNKSHLTSLGLPCPLTGLRTSNVIN